MEKLKYYKNKLIQKLTGKQNDSDKQYYTNEEIHKLMELENGKGINDDLDEAKALSNYWKGVRDIYLDDKVDDFIDWYYKNMVKGNYTDIGEFHKPNDMRNFIEKMAVWYELRYPDYEINRIMHCAGQEGIEVSDVMFNNNPYINELFDENADVRALDWDEFYNTKAFINSLSWDERYLFAKHKYKDLVYLDRNFKLHSPVDAERNTAHLHLTTNGFVKESVGISAHTHSLIKDKDIIGMHVKDVVKLLSDKDLLPKENELEKAIKDIEYWNYQKEEMLNCVMYRIIERGGKRMGPRRAFLFAKEFDRNIDIPMKYGVDYSDPGLRSFILEYIKAGGREDLKCYVGYFYRTSDNEKFDTVSVKEMLKTVNNDCVTKYTPEETDLYQRMVNAINNQVDYEMVRKEEVKQLRIERKLNKSRNK